MQWRMVLEAKAALVLLRCGECGTGGLVGRAGWEWT